MQRGLIRGASQQRVQTLRLGVQGAALVWVPAFGYAFSWVFATIGLVTRIRRPRNSPRPSRVIWAAGRPAKKYSPAAWRCPPGCPATAVGQAQPGAGDDGLAGMQDEGGGRGEPDPGYLEVVVWGR